MSHHALYCPPRPTTTTAAVVVFWRFIIVVPKNRGLIFTSKRRYIIRSLLVMHEHCAGRIYIAAASAKGFLPLPSAGTSIAFKHLIVSAAPHQGLSKL